MASPTGEIVVSAEPTKKSPKESIHSPSQAKTSAAPVEEEEPEHEHGSKKSFKRKYIQPLASLISRYHKLLKKYLEIRTRNEQLHANYKKASALTQQLANENASILLSEFPVNDRNILDFIIELNPSSPPASPVPDEDTKVPDAKDLQYDAHFGYSPTPSPPPEVALQLTQEQIDMGMVKVEPGSSQGATGNMGPPQPVVREESADTFRRGSRGGARGGSVMSMGRKRKDRDSEGEDNAAVIGRKRSRG